MKIDLSYLNPEQKNAVLEIRKPVLLMAPVGTGKTKVLALRAAHAIDCGIESSSILCLSFTNRAAKEVRERLSKLLGKKCPNGTTKTFPPLFATALPAATDIIGIVYDF